jgi:hypothetical protein
MEITEINSLLVVVVLLGSALTYYWNEPTFRTPLFATLLLVVWAGMFTPLMYLAAGLSTDFCDYTLADFDALMGIHLPSIVEWTAEHPTLKRVLEIAYASVGLQTALVLILNQTPSLFVRRFIIGSSVCLVAMCFFPAVGPFFYYAYEPSASQVAYLEHLIQCRETGLVLCKSAEGLITVPSFHAIWAVFLIASSGRLWIPATVLNVMVIAATLTTGWHYGTDVVIGLLVAGIVLLITRKNLT